MVDIIKSKRRNETEFSLDVDAFIIRIILCISLFAIFLVSNAFSLDSEYPLLGAMYNISLDYDSNLKPSIKSFNLYDVDIGNYEISSAQTFFQLVLECDYNKDGKIDKQFRYFIDLHPGENLLFLPVCTGRIAIYYLINSTLLFDGNYDLNESTFLTHSNIEQVQKYSSNQANNKIFVGYLVATLIILIILAFSYYISKFFKK